MSRLTEASRRLVGLAAALDIPEAVADEAVLAYDTVAQWLADENSPLQPHSPELYPQGSFRLGTPILPLTKPDEFDIDLVCLLDLSKDDTTQAGLKKLLGDRLRSNAELKHRLSSTRRCWTLSFAPRFHLDVLPCIPDPAHVGEGILLTDTELTRWQFSNPIGYSVWFFDRMRVALQEARLEKALASNATIDDVPEWRVRTPLQRAVQLLKRHRDIRFAADLDNRPVSIVITTLAARAYKSQNDVAMALINLCSEMPAFIENRSGKWWVENPAHAEENFADKWNETPSRRDAFMKWLDVLRADIDHLADAASDRDAYLLLEKSLGSIPSAAVTATRFGAGSLARSATLAAPEVDDISHLKLPPWPSNVRFACTAEAQVFRSERKGSPLRALGQIVFKKAGLRFRARTDTPPPYQIKWQITNSGNEARKAGQLRGGFDDGEGSDGSVRWERTSYGGTHFVEALVVKDGTLVARSGRIHVRIAR